MSAVDLTVKLGPLTLKNPVVTASGTFGYGTEFSPFLDLSTLGGIVVKGLSLRPRRGNEPPRICETPSGMLNAIGLQNVGVDAFLQEKLPALLPFDTAVLANVYGEREEEYVQVCERLEGARGLAGIELNVSCPNTSRGGMQFGVDPVTLERLVAAVRRVTSLPLIVKLSPNVTDIGEPARAAVAGGADILSLVNTFTGMGIDAESRRPVLNNVVGGLSGPAIKPLALYMVHRVAKAVDVPIMGMGGIMNAVDAVEFFLAGAAAVQIGTSNFLNPGGAATMVRDLEQWCSRHQVEKVRDLTGGLRT
ncbi:MAG: dihydroorotate dehydrogenase [Acidobacteria bacterium]|nr:MAG: dihydroorotate dehydrogenase [Acidobacteriota bacterium]TDI41566.1 MAG: dihydroorotate dehydrogenase [Acidobacteriota bacterium]